MRQIRRSVGKYLRKLREEEAMTYTEVSAYLELHQVKCSRTNLARIEDGLSSVRHDILAGLSLIYNISSEQILFRGEEEKKKSS